ncbi:hypothetical protein CLM84_21610, partial [Streptomyces albidoflavus]
MTRRPWTLRSARGSVALSTAVFVPIALILLGLLIACGRIALAQGAADAAARDA